MSGREMMVGDKALSSLRVIDLKAELDRRGLSKSGSKKELVDRLKANLLLDKDREEAAVSVSEEELPNSSVTAKLSSDDNPFVREYLESQAELFHSQQVAKKLYREEQKRESEGSGASADERERSPLKSPAKPIESHSPARHHEPESEKEESKKAEAPTKRQRTTRFQKSVPEPEPEDTEAGSASPEKVTTIDEQAPKIVGSAAEPKKEEKRAESPTRRQRPSRFYKSAPEPEPETEVVSSTPEKPTTAEVSPEIVEPRGEPEKEEHKRAESPPKRLRSTRSQKSATEPSEDMETDSSSPEKRTVTEEVDSKIVEPEAEPEKEEAKAESPTRRQRPSRFQKSTPEPIVEESEAVSSSPEKPTTAEVTPEIVDQGAEPEKEETKVESSPKRQRPSRFEKSVPETEAETEVVSSSPEKPTTAEVTPEIVDQGAEPEKEETKVESSPKRQRPSRFEKSVPETEAETEVVSSSPEKPTTAEVTPEIVQKETEPEKEENKKAESPPKRQRPSRFHKSAPDGEADMEVDSSSPAKPATTVEVNPESEAEPKEETEKAESPAKRQRPSRFQKSVSETETEKTETVSASPIAEKASAEIAEPEAESKTETAEAKTESEKRNLRTTRFQKPVSISESEEPMETEPIPASPVKHAHVEITAIAPKIVELVKLSESPPRKIRAHSPITAPTPDKVTKPTEPKKVKEPITMRRDSKPVEKESILDEVLDYGEEDVDVATVLEAPPPPPNNTSLKKSSIISLRSRPSREEITMDVLDDTDFEPLEFERRVLKLKPNRHSQRRKDKFTEDRDRRTREKERENARKIPVEITCELLEEWYPNIVLLTDEEMTQAEADYPSFEGEEDEKVRITRTFSITDSIDPEGMEHDHGGGEFGGEEAEEEDEETPQIPEMDLSIQRKISLISMDDETAKGHQTPPRRAPTQLILVTNLVRPFTVPQLKELLQRTGNVLDLWVDKIKSRCVAKYDTEDEAIETRTALHGVRWPSSNPKSLSVDFTTEERADDLRKKDSGYIEEKPATSQHVREWDVGKKSPVRESRKRPHSREGRETEGRGDREREGRAVGERERKRSRRSRSHSVRVKRRSRTPHSDRKDRNGDVKKSESSGKTLDELFRKTVSVPCIYWLPLNPQQISEKEELRRKRMEERERRIAEMQQQPQNQRNQR